MAMTRLISVRLPAELLEKLDHSAGGVGVSRGAMIRELLGAGLGDSTLEVTLREAHFRLQPAMRVAIGKLIGRFHEELPAAIEEALANED